MTFRELHDGALPLLLPNAWDVASALAFADAGFPAIGTTSFGVAASAGEPDGGRTSRDATHALARRLAALPCHVSADVEDGYDDDPARVAELRRGLGVAGINLEDSTAERLVAPAAHAAKVAAVKARVPERVRQRADRHLLARAGRDRGGDARARGRLRRGGRGRHLRPRRDRARRPARRSAPPSRSRSTCSSIPGLSLERLAALGVRRVSTGSLPYRRAIDAAVEVATSVRDGRPVPAATPYPELQARLARFRG